MMKRAIVLLSLLAVTLQVTADNNVLISARDVIPFERTGTYLYNPSYGYDVLFGDMGQSYTFAASAESLLVSGVGSQDIGLTVRLTGLDEGWDVDSVDVVLSAGPQIAGTHKWNRVNSFKVIGSTLNTGKIVAYTYRWGPGSYTQGAADTTEYQRAVIMPYIGKSLQAIYTVPDSTYLDLNAFMPSASFSNASSTNAAGVITIFVRNYGDGWNILDQVSFTTQQNFPTRVYSNFQALPGKTDVRVRVGVTAAPTDISLLLTGRLRPVY